LRRPEQGRSGHLRARRHQHLAARGAESGTNAASHDPLGVHRRNDADLGYTFSQPAIVKSHDTAGGTGRWVVGFGNGYNSTLADGTASATGNAVLFIRDAATGRSIAKIDTGVGNAQRPAGVAWDNGLSTPAFVDIDAIASSTMPMRATCTATCGSSICAIRIRRTGRSPTGTSPKRRCSRGRRLGNRQPITVAPEVTRGPKGAGMVVLFGTGKYLEPSDLLSSPERPQSFYGIIDRNTGVRRPIGDLAHAAHAADDRQ
jgi:type IV pilus assembly protein PilY1